MMPYELESEDYWQHVQQVTETLYPVGVHATREMVQVLPDNDQWNGPWRWIP